VIPQDLRFEMTKTSVLIVENLTGVLDVRGSVHHSTVHREKSNKMQQSTKIFIIPYLYEAQHVSGDTPPIIRSLKLHW
jgi:hypothetical protein